MILNLSKRYSQRPDPFSKTGSVLIRTSAFYPNGDRIYLVATGQPDGGVVLSDGGCTIDSISNMGIKARLARCQERLLQLEVWAQRLDDGSTQLSTWFGDSAEANDAAEYLTLAAQYVMEKSVSAKHLKELRNAQIERRAQRGLAVSKPSLTANSPSASSQGQKARFGSMSLRRQKRSASGDSTAPGHLLSSP